jgi:hypothetical protein
VQQSEWEDIQRSGQFRLPAELGLEVKYFATTRAAAQRYAEMARANFHDAPYLIVATTISPDEFDAATKFVADGCIDALVLEEESLTRLTPPQLSR